MDINLNEISTDFRIDNLCQDRDDYKLFSESQGRFVVTIDPKNQYKFQELMRGRYVPLGRVRGDDKFVMRDGIPHPLSRIVVDTTVGELAESYKSTFRGF